jgi:PadR family transcriptional regulator AphA
VSTPRLSETSYAVLGLLEQCGPSTAYQLKQIAQESIFHFWSIPHTQLYTECARLAQAGLLEEEQEQHGRRRRVFSLAASGRRELELWRADPHTDIYELRDPGLLKRFCGAEPAALSEEQQRVHEARLARYEEFLAVSSDEPSVPAGMRLSLKAGIGHAREYIRFWSGVREKG